MPSKRRKIDIHDGDTRDTPRSSRAQTPATKSSQATTSEGEEEDIVLSQAIHKNIQKFDISSFPYLVPPGVSDSASRHFKHDYTGLALKSDHQNRPLRVDGWGKLILENFHPLAPQVQDFLVTIAEPLSRPIFLHEYKLTTHSLYAAVSVGLNAKDIITTLDRFSKNEMPPNVVKYIQQCGRSYGMVKMVLKDNKYFLETADAGVLQMLLQDREIKICRVHGAEQVTENAVKAAAIAIAGSKEAKGVQQVQGSETKQPSDDATGKGQELDPAVRALEDEGNDEDQVVTHAFQITDDKVSKVAERCLDLHYPALEEYDFRNDRANADLDIDLRPGTQIRPYQEKSLTKMFGNGRAMSGIIVLPCGAGKTLVGVTAACTIKKGVVVLATSNMSAIQWKNEFIKWSNINPDDIALFSSEQKSTFAGNTGIIITTYSMVTNTRERAHQSAQMMKFLSGREWGLMLLDEVHVVPANMFRKVIGSIKTHSKLGLTATLLREDNKIEDLNFLIGPKLYEANWMELSEQGYIAKVQCAEIWCPMPAEFYEQYLKAGPRAKQLFCAMNPTKFQACQYLINYHESRGDKIIVFSDNVYALEFYATKFGKPYLYGGTSEEERQTFLELFRNSPKCSTLFLSKIGDTSLDLPEATVLIQISAQYGSRRQEAQRLGRILRAKRRNEEGFNAFFYSIVSKDTVEMVYSSRRQAFLVDQGYAFKVITRLRDLDKLPDLAFVTAESRRELLQRTVIDSESKDSLKALEKEQNGLLADGNMFYGADGIPVRQSVKRRAGMLQGLSGGQDMAAIEQNERVTGMTKKEKNAKMNPFFKGMSRERKKRD